MRAGHEVCPPESETTILPDCIIARMTPNDCQLTAATSFNGQCPRCATHFVCEITAGKSHCWCMDLPAVLPVSPESCCLCRDCLLDEINGVNHSPELPFPAQPVA